MKTKKTHKHRRQRLSPWAMRTSCRGQERNFFLAGRSAALLSILSSLSRFPVLLIYRAICSNLLLVYTAVSGERVVGEWRRRTKCLASVLPPGLCEYTQALLQQQEEHGGLLHPGAWALSLREPAAVVHRAPLPTLDHIIQDKPAENGVHSLKEQHFITCPICTTGIVFWVPSSTSHFSRGKVQFLFPLYRLWRMWT